MNDKVTETREKTLLQWPHTKTDVVPLFYSVQNLELN